LREGFVWVEVLRSLLIETAFFSLAQKGLRFRWSLVVYATEAALAMQGSVIFSGDEQTKLERKGKKKKKKGKIKRKKKRGEKKKEK